MRQKRVGTLSYPLGRSLPRAIAQTKAVSWPRPMVVVLLGAIVIAGLCLAYLWQEATILDLTAQRESARATLTAIQEVNRWLGFEIEKAFSLDRIERLARGKLHMVDPTSIRYVRIDSAPKAP